MFFPFPCLSRKNLGLTVFPLALVLYYNSFYCNKALLRSTFNIDVAHWIIYRPHKLEQLRAGLNRNVLSTILLHKGVHRVLSIRRLHKRHASNAVVHHRRNINNLPSLFFPKHTILHHCSIEKKYARFSFKVLRLFEYSI